MALVVITGAARSGKSVVAQTLAGSSAGRVTVAVFGCAVDDTEMAERIARHRAERPETWNTVEAKDSVEWTERVGEGTLMLDCLGTLLSMIMAEVDAEYAFRGEGLGGADVLPAEFEAEVERRFLPLLGWLTRRIDNTVVVTNEVGWGVVPAYPAGRVFRDLLGRGNRALIDRAQSAHLVVGGRCIDLTRLPREVSWPR
ncbi:MAG: bifunctional adenosylcobinamide kinase/adenosylcobinamide-phosphate guanylyltransferase [Actinomycetota bacterium]|nr:bifunctional adenosylcobinamide kinase/adenosylcobinamide-phosphate guanylyltransferase [Actinomycetota bacterium]MDZ4180470.1 bifunctional adenosylcobinamide kinase/adenosylcobinamide-phosphate guanylyltransferase [Coriobacteriia bacterium]